MGEADPQPIKASLDDVGRRLGLGGAAKTGIIWQRWPEIVGPAIAAHAEPTSLKEGVLRVRAEAPAWATEIGYLGNEIAQRANDAVGARLVNEVRVWTGPGKIARAEPSARASEPVPATSPQPHHDDPIEAFHAAHEAWRKRRGGRVR